MMNMAASYDSATQPMQRWRDVLTPQASGVGRGLLAGLAGCLFAWSLPPSGIWWATPVATVLVLTALAGSHPRVRLALGLLTGAGWFGLSLFWLHAFSLVGFALLVLMSMPLLAAGLMLPFVRHHPAAGVPAVLAAMELIRSVVPFGGFPLGGLSLGQVDGPWLGWATLAGPWAVVAAATATGALAWHVAVAKAWRRRALALATIIASLTAPASAAFLSSTAVGPTWRVAAVQGGGPRGIPAVLTSPDGAFLRHDRLTRDASIKPGTDAIVWPEDVVDVDGSFAGSAQEREIRDLARTKGLPLLVGVVEDVGATGFSNAAISYDRAGGMVGRYDKVHRVPFGEYVPFRQLLGHFVDLSLVPRDAVPGTSRPTVPLGRVHAGVVISYEVFFPAQARSAVRAGATVLVVPTNAASFATAQVPAQELAAARLRAVENQRDLIQVAPTGYTAAITAHGRVLARTGLGAAIVLTADLRLRTGRTLYSRLGDRPAELVTLLILCWRRRPARHGSGRVGGRRHGPQRRTG
jgi:apolipoprotein N-acyltransferase